MNPSRDVVRLDLKAGLNSINLMENYRVIIQSKETSSTVAVLKVDTLFNKYLLCPSKNTQAYSSRKDIIIHRRCNNKDCWPLECGDIFSLNRISFQFLLEEAVKMEIQPMPRILANKELVQSSKVCINRAYLVFFGCSNNNISNNSSRGNIGLPSRNIGTSSPSFPLGQARKQCKFCGAGYMNQNIFNSCENCSYRILLKMADNKRQRTATQVNRISNEKLDGSGTANDPISLLSDDDSVDGDDQHNDTNISPKPNNNEQRKTLCESSCKENNSDRYCQKETHLKYLLTNVGFKNAVSTSGKTGSADFVQCESKELCIKSKTNGFCLARVGKYGFEYIDEAESTEAMKGFEWKDHRLNPNSYYKFLERDIFS